MLDCSLLVTPWHVRVVGFGGSKPSGYLSRPQNKAMRRKVLRELSGKNYGYNTECGGRRKTGSKEAVEGCINSPLLCAVLLGSQWGYKALMETGMPGTGLLIWFLPALKVAWCIGGLLSKKFLLLNWALSSEWERAFPREWVLASPDDEAAFELHFHLTGNRWSFISSLENSLLDRSLFLFRNQCPRL